MAVLALNRRATEPMALRVLPAGLDAGWAVEAAHAMVGHLAATNTADAPDCVVPTPMLEASTRGGEVTARLRPASWNVLASTPA